MIMGMLKLILILEDQATNHILLILFWKKGLKIRILQVSLYEAKNIFRIIQWQALIG